ncbi:MAG: sulfurtransferase TusA family protein [Dehalococcoidia bacterium]|jgi:tRNA 2-thiouridine synthesizing protein A|nr:sulfurtransferase TusA family protein [Dehalococcoidia bacterium]
MIDEITDTEPDETLDLRGLLCPNNFVQTKLKLEEMDVGRVLEVVLDDGEAMRDIPRSVKEDGNRIVGVEKLADSSYKLLIRKDVD